ncbi:class I SAM-dependent methyltransferase [Micromonospora sp. HM5-17]|uniref:class I SAM-dependent methyltransferase n=1 Tax=Micromonospora sp. HM5-17 TaxID=2487710 RepID=UPI0011CDDA95|nr:class I SAM-dependent methyltransferase [Micromonospora sp. HM5-17]
MTRVRALMPGVPRSRKEVLASLHVLSSLRAEGWHRSLSGGGPVDADGAPRPWLTYPAVAWLERALTPATRVFEYGAGSSTSWFARPGRVREIVSVEHDPGWFARLPQPPNGRIVHVPCTGTWWETDDDAPYVRAIADGAPWDVVVIDGMGRNTCARVAADHLTATGLVVLDDTDNAASLPAQTALADRGLGRLDFWGFKPGMSTRLCTSVFSRDFNAWLATA